MYFTVGQKRRFDPLIPKNRSQGASRSIYIDISRFIAIHNYISGSIYIDISIYTCRYISMNLCRYKSIEIYQYIAIDLY
jgi:hypothetical protein